jgi:hypothetical protein
MRGESGLVRLACLRGLAHDFGYGLKSLHIASISTSVANRRPPQLRMTRAQIYF